jgi:pantetheine-phosphate adenylyltransferase
MSQAIYPGTFDPVTLGHLDVIRRAAGLFDRLVVGVGENPEKRCLFTLQERLEMVREEIAGLPNAEALPFDGLMVDFAKAQGISLILRGIRTVSDLEYEIQMAFTNRACGGVETLFIAPEPEHAYVNARFVKEIAARGGKVEGLVSAGVAERLRRKRADPPRKEA